MAKIAPSLHQFFTALGLDSQDVTVYLQLTTRGQMTVLEASKSTGIPRTQLYRILDSMKKRGFVEEIVDEHRTLYQVVSTDILERLVKNREELVQSLRHQLPTVLSELTANIGMGSGETTVKFYRGKEGIRQMVWHTLRADAEIVGYTYRKIDEIIGKQFEADWREAFIAKGLTFRDIYSDVYLESIGGISGLDKETPTYSSSRFISQKILDIRIQMDIYNDVVAQYTWEGKDVFGVEIYNPMLVSFQKQMFELVWNQATRELS
jgi:sugar-specific transcriptional regulator TrmB